MCKFCEDSRIIEDYCIASGYQIHVRQTLLSNMRNFKIEFGTRNALDFHIDDIDFEVNFCPMCGRKLKEL